MNPTSTAVARIWAGVLGAAPDTADADFFAVGGTSLALVRFLAAVQDEFGVELPLDRLFAEGFTLARASATVEELLLAAADPDELAELTGELENLGNEEIQLLLADGA